MLKPWVLKILKEVTVGWQNLLKDIDWIDDISPGLIEGYEPRNIFNYDETGLFYKCLPGKFVFFFI
jgi:hypothetical protein